MNLNFLSTLSRTLFAVGLISSAIARAAAPTPRVFFVSPSSLVETRARVLRNDPALQPAVTQLRKEADGFLKLKPPSVLDKPSVAASGDKHDYFTYGPYWWPDPTKPDGLPYIRRDGDVNPAS